MRNNKSSLEQSLNRINRVNKVDEKVKILDELNALINVSINRYLQGYPKELEELGGLLDIKGKLHQYNYGNITSFINLDWQYKQYGGREKELLRTIEILALPLRDYCIRKNNEDDGNEKISLHARLAQLNIFNENLEAYFKGMASIRKDDIPLKVYKDIVYKNMSNSSIPLYATPQEADRLFSREANKFLFWVLVKPFETTRVGKEEVL